MAKTVEQLTEEFALTGHVTVSIEDFVLAYEKWGIELANCGEAIKVPFGYADMAEFDRACAEQLMHCLISKVEEGKG